LSDGECALVDTAGSSVAIEVSSVGTMAGEVAFASSCEDIALSVGDLSIEDWGLHIK
jgi:hypothetical protein